MSHTFSHSQRKYTALIIMAVVAYAVTAVLSGCAGALKFKQAGVTAIEAATSAVGHAQDAEQQLFVLRTLPQLTPERHIEFQHAIIEALDALAVANRALHVAPGQEDPGTTIDRIFVQVGRAREKVDVVLQILVALGEFAFKSVAADLRDAATQLDRFLGRAR